MRRHPDGDDMVAWFGVGWHRGPARRLLPLVLAGREALGQRGARATRPGRFTFNMSLHKAIGLVFCVPLTIVAFTGIAFAFPNMKAGTRTSRPPQRDFALWSHPSGQHSEKPAGREPIGLDEFAEIIEREFPNRAWTTSASAARQGGVYAAWVTRGFDPWTREGGAGNTWVTSTSTRVRSLRRDPRGRQRLRPGVGRLELPVAHRRLRRAGHRLLWVLVGISPLVLGFTGITMYLIRRRKRAKRGPPTPPAGPEREERTDDEEEVADAPVAVG